MRVHLFSCAFRHLATRWSSAASLIWLTFRSDMRTLVADRSHKTSSLGVLPRLTPSQTTLSNAETERSVAELDLTAYILSNYMESSEKQYRSSTGK